MGVERVVKFSAVPALPWAAVARALAARQWTGSIRMIDSLPAFPDETPPDDWKELRVGFPAGMVTLRRDGDSVRCVTWGTADRDLLAAQTACAEALAEVGGGSVVPEAA